VCFAASLGPRLLLAVVDELLNGTGRGTRGKQADDKEGAREDKLRSRGPSEVHKVHPAARLRRRAPLTRAHADT